MKKPKYLLWIIAVEIIGILSGVLSREGIRIYSTVVQKPELTPPAILFPVVWTVLYGLMGISAARIAAGEPGGIRSRGLNLFVIQLVLNFFWSLIFFNVQAYGIALVWLLLLWVTVFLMILQFYMADQTAAWLQIPYLIWLTFAAYLNYGVWMLNR